MAETNAPMTLRLLTPAGTSAEVPCDSVQLTLRDDAKGRGGGWIGILRDHAPAVMALGNGGIQASLDGECVFRASADGGFASVGDNVITVITDSAVIEGRESAEEE